MPLFDYLPIGRQLRDEEEKRKRLAQGPSIAAKLMDRGDLEPDEINAIVKIYGETGEFSIPTSRDVRAEGPATQSGELPMMQEPVRLGKKPKKYFAPGDGGKYTQVELPEGAGTDFDAEFVNSPDTNGYDIYVNKQTGDEIRREPNGQRGNRTVRVGSTSGSGSGGGRDPIQERAALDVLRIGAKMRAEGLEVPPEFAGRELKANSYLGLPNETVELEPARAAG